MEKNQGDPRQSKARRVDNGCRYWTRGWSGRFARHSIERGTWRSVVDFKAVLSMLNIDSAGQAL